MSAARKGKKRKPHSEETKAKISASMKGKQNVKGKHLKLVDVHRIYDYKTNKLEGK